MKKTTIISFFFLLLVAGSNFSASSNPSNGTPDSVIMGQGYASDIYYSFENGVVATVSRSNWDIGFHTSLWSATIITNGGAGINLYTYPNADTTGWATVDTAGITAWPIMYDSEDNWEDGAFVRNAGGHPDYGWGKYNPISHDVVGDSVYILKTSANAYKKIWIQRKNSINNKYFIRLANLDGSDDHVVELDINPFRNTNFVYYDLASENFVEREPDTASWDILFTKYMGIQPNETMYGVVGVLSNFDVYANEFYPVAPDFIDYASMPFDSTKSSIGWEWKTFDMNTVTWSVADSAAFFVRTRKGDIYKLVFTSFEGTSTGKIIFTREPLTSGVADQARFSPEVSVYPNPVRDRLTIDFGKQISGEAVVSIFDITGRQVYSSNIQADNRTVSLSIGELSLHKGFHLIKIETADRAYSSKFMVY
jgi:hypothetical protein